MFILLYAEEKQWEAKACSNRNIHVHYALQTLLFVASNNFMTFKPIIFWLSSSTI